jgi:hypothetical protein
LSVQSPFLFANNLKTRMADMARVKRWSYFWLGTLVLLLVGATIAYTWDDAGPTGSAAGDNGAYLPFLAQESNFVPACPDSLHDSSQWHALTNLAANCHYRHLHKHDPYQINDIFGPPGAWFGGASISYPWQTPHENEEKHEAYNWIVRRGIPSQGRDEWIQDFRLQIHATSAPFTRPDGTLHGGYLARYHSFSLEARVCNSAGQCGIVRTGGWVDFGNLEIEGFGDLPLPGEEDAVSDLSRRRLHFFYQDPEMRAKGQLGAHFFWYGRQIPPQENAPAAKTPLKPVLIAVATKDASVNVDPAHLYELHFFCPEYDCNKNDSTIQAHVVQITVPEDYAGADGRVNFSAYTNRYGELVTGCISVGLDCIPLLIENAPATDGPVQHRDDTHLVGHPSMGYDDFDTSPPGQWWIKYPN